MRRSKTPSPLRIMTCCIIVFAILFIVPLFVYSAFAAVMGTEMPEEASPALFMVSVVIEKIGHATVFVLIFYLGRSSLSRHWVPYALAWWTMFALGEFALALRQPTYTADMAVGGVIAEAIYLPLAAFVTQQLLGVPKSETA